MWGPTSSHLSWRGSQPPALCHPVSGVPPSYSTATLHSFVGPGRTFRGTALATGRKGNLACWSHMCPSAHTESLMGSTVACEVLYLFLEYLCNEQIKHLDRSRLRLWRKGKSFFLLFEREPPHFYFALGPKNYGVSHEYINKPVFVFKAIINFHRMRKQVSYKKL